MRNNLPAPVQVRDLNAYVKVCRFCGTPASSQSVRIGGGCRLLTNIPHSWTFITQAEFLFGNERETDENI